MKKKIAPKKGHKDFVTVGENNFGGHCLTGSSKKPKPIKNAENLNPFSKISNETEVWQ